MNSKPTAGPAELLMRAARHLQVIKNQNLEFYGTGPTQRRILIFVVANPGITQALIARLLKLDKSTVCSIVHKLHRAGLVTKQPSQEDRRAFALYPSPMAKTCATTFKEESEYLDSIVTHGLTSEECAQLDKLLRHASAITKHVLDLPPGSEFPPYPYPEVPSGRTP